MPSRPSASAISTSPRSPVTSRISSGAPRRPRLKSTPRASPRASLKWRGNAGLTWESGPWTAGVERTVFDSYFAYAGRSSSSVIAAAVLNQGSARIPSQTYHDLSVSYRFKKIGGLSGLLGGAQCRWASETCSTKARPFSPQPVRRGRPPTAPTAIPACVPFISPSPGNSDACTPPKIVPAILSALFLTSNGSAEA